MRWTDLARGAAAALLFGPAAMAQGLPPLDVHGEWVRAAAAGANTAMFLDLRNVGAVPDQLVGAACPAADGTALQAPENGGGLQNVAALKLPADGTLRLAPGHAQITLTGLKQALVTGTYLSCVIRLQGHGERIILALIAPADATTAPATP